MIEKKIIVDGKEYNAKCSGLLPREYRAKFGTDLFKDIGKITEAYKNANGDETAVLSRLDLVVFENIAWMMLKKGGSDVGDSPEEWLDSLDGVFSVYEALPEIMELWKSSNKTTSISKKK